MAPTAIAPDPGPPGEPHPTGPARGVASDFGMASTSAASNPGPARNAAPDSGFARGVASGSGRAPDSTPGPAPDRRGTSTGSRRATPPPRARKQ
ncbi:hypothetical protein GCM10009556_016010 [Acrocarpospora pleiomorpha]